MTATAVLPDVEMIRRAFEAINGPGEVRELRIPKPKRPETGRPKFYKPMAGWFDNTTDAVRAVGNVHGEHCEAVYVTVNPTDPELMARTNNRIAEASSTTADANITRLACLFVDIDAERPAGVPATDTEKAAALAQRDAIRAYLAEVHGWPDAYMIGDSGNGGALLYPIDLENTADNVALLERILKALRAEFGMVDETTYNPARLMKLPGTVAAKGDGSPTRPWRVSAAVFAAERELVTVEQLRAVAAGAPEPAAPKASSNGHYDGPPRSWTMEDLLRENRLTATVKHTEYGTAHDLDRCLSSDDHTDGASFIEMNSGAIVYRCHHKTCRDVGWQTLKDRGRVRIPGTFTGSVTRGGKPLPRSKRQAAVSDDDLAEAGKTPASLGEFYAYAVEHMYIDVPTRHMWPAASINSRIRPLPTGRTKENGKPEYEPASAWLDRNRSVEQITWLPGEPMVIDGHVVDREGLIPHPSRSIFNLYRPPTILRGDATEAEPWIKHVHKVYPDDAEHIIRWLAQRVQQPHVKVNHALLLGGEQGIGKDTILTPVRQAVGPWNVSEVSPVVVLGRFNGFVKSVILHISEARDLGDFDRYRFYEHMKELTAAPPVVLRVDEKNRQEYYVPNLCGVMLTTNHKTTSIYLPADDRRHYVAWSELTKAGFDADYWRRLYGWYESGGNAHVAAYLAELDLSAFNPKADPPKTEAFWAIVDAGRAPEDDELADALDTLDNPAAVTLAQIVAVAGTDLGDWLRDRRHSRQIPHRMEAAGYEPVRNPDTKDHRWKVGDSRQAVYARRDISVRERILAARSLTSTRR